eukprot:10134752-Alexandrium_andersonii.AAC.1
MVEDSGDEQMDADSFLRFCLGALACTCTLAFMSFDLVGASQWSALLHQHPPEKLQARREPRI